MQVAFYGKFYKSIRTIVDGWMVGLSVHFNSLFKGKSRFSVEFIRVDIVACNRSPSISYHFGFEFCTIPVKQTNNMIKKIICHLLHLIAIKIAAQSHAE
jgi:hypothetical protein